MEKLRAKLETAQRALKTFEEILKEPYSKLSEMPQYKDLNILLKYFGKLLKSILNIKKG